MLALFASLVAIAGDPVVVNGSPLSRHQLEQLSAPGVQAVPGAYWYDAASGLAGRVGAEAWFPAGLPLGSMQDDASRGRTGVYVNGRQIPAAEQAFYSTLFGAVAPGAYWLDASGNVGRVGQPQPIDNLVARLRASPADAWLSGTEWSGSMSSGTVAPTARDSVFSVDGELLTLPN